MLPALFNTAESPKLTMDEEPLMVTVFPAARFSVRCKCECPAFPRVAPLLTLIVPVPSIDPLLQVKASFRVRTKVVDAPLVRVLLASVNF